SHRPGLLNHSGGFYLTRKPLNYLRLLITPAEQVICKSLQIIDGPTSEYFHIVERESIANIAGVFGARSAHPPPASPPVHLCPRVRLDVRQSRLLGFCC